MIRGDQSKRMLAFAARRPAVNLGFCSIRSWIDKRVAEYHALVRRSVLDRDEHHGL
jgi:hypothetical protein